MEVPFIKKIPIEGEGPIFFALICIRQLSETEFLNLRPYYLP